MQKSTLSSKLFHKITFLENEADNGLDEENWKEIFHSFADIKPMFDNKFGSIEKFSFGHIVTEAFFMFKVRYSKLINAKMRIRFNQRFFEIKRIINLNERNEILKIIALEM